MSRRHVPTGGPVTVTTPSGQYLVSGSISSTAKGCQRDKGGRPSEGEVTGRCCATSHNASARKPGLSANDAHIIWRSRRGSHVLPNANQLLPADSRMDTLAKCARRSVEASRRGGCGPETDRAFRQSDMSDGQLHPGASPDTRAVRGGHATPTIDLIYFVRAETAAMGMDRLISVPLCSFSVRWGKK